MTDNCQPPPLDLAPRKKRDTLGLESVTECTDSCCPSTKAVVDDCCDAKQEVLEQLAQDSVQRRVLWTVLAINAVMFVAEFTGGVIAGSAALMADSVDMLGDAFVYGLSLYAMGRGARWNAGAALAKGGFILLFGIGVMIEIGVKLVSGIPPSTPIMLAMGAVALMANLICFSMLWRFRNKDLNMSSTFECSRNDLIANVGVLVAAGGVAYFASPWPDIAAAAIIAALFLRSAFGVLSRAWPQFQAAAH
jgi:cation diffusion facilitator family transporter